jgi:hypothetical protein
VRIETAVDAHVAIDVHANCIVADAYSVDVHPHSVVVDAYSGSVSPFAFRTRGETDATTA